MKKSNDYIRNFFTIFFARKLIIVAVSLMIIGGAVLFALFYPPVYGAKASVILKGGTALKNPESIEKTRIEISSIGESDLFSEIEIIRANVVAERTADELMKNGFDFEFGLLDNEEKKESACKESDQISG